jgi:hypothetical protein
MRRAAYVLLALGFLALGLIASKPGPEDVEAALEEAVTAEIAKLRAGEAASLGEGLLTLGCQIDARECYRLLRAVADVRYTDIGLMARVEIALGRERATCYGAAGRFFCP